MPAVLTEVRSLRPDRGELLAEVARLYYDEDRNQVAIAERLGMSRSNVSRLLEEARRTGIVRIRIAHPVSRAPALEDQLCRTFGLVDARILAFSAVPQAPERVLEKVGRLGAEYLLGRVQDGDTIGLSWGTSVQQVVDAIEVDRPLRAEVVQLLGGLSQVSPTISGHDLARRTGDALGAPYHFLHAPAIVGSRAIRDALVADPAIQRVLSLGGRSTIAVVGIGTLEDGSSRLLLEEAGLTRAERARLQRAGIVGDVCARHFDVRGQPGETGLEDRVVGIDLDGLRNIPMVIGVAAGVVKAPAMLGALRGGLLNVLVTDEVAAREVLRLTDCT